MKKTLTTVWQNEEAQDVVEYTLLLAFVVVASAALLFNGGNSIQGILFVTTNNLNAANTMAS